MLLKFTALPPGEAPEGSQPAPFIFPVDVFSAAIPSYVRGGKIQPIIVIKSGQMVAVQETFEEIEDMLLRALPENQREIVESLKRSRVGVS
jgi:hypothetical protein